MSDYSERMKEDPGCLSSVFGCLGTWLLLAIVGIVLMYIILNVYFAGFNNPCNATYDPKCIERKYTQCLQSEQFTEDQCKVISELGK